MQHLETAHMLLTDQNISAGLLQWALCHRAKNIWENVPVTTVVQNSKNIPPQQISCIQFPAEIKTTGSKSLTTIIHFHKMHNFTE